MSMTPQTWTQVRQAIEQTVQDGATVSSGAVRMLLEALDAETARADAAEERLAIQIEANLALEEVVNELALRLQATEQEQGQDWYRREREYSDGG
jgi:hypothetical protein